MHARDIPTTIPTLRVLPWSDPVIDQVGYDPRSRYVERFWLGILGPSATWLMRYLVDGLERSPEGYPLDLAECATALGLGRYRGTSSAFPRTIARCCQFGTSRLTADASLEVRRRLPPLTLRQVRRLSPVLQAEHAAWVDRAPAALGADDLRDQARRLALSLLELGEDGEATERQLHRWRFHPALASEATAWAVERHGPMGSGSPTAPPEVVESTSGAARPTAEVMGSTEPTADGPTLEVMSSTEPSPRP
jgi:hypothetical protein